MNLPGTILSAMTGSLAISELQIRVVILAVGAVVAASCALLGAFLVLRKTAMLGDAISHAVLPGIVIAFLLTGSRTSVWLIVGAGVLGLVTVFLVGLLNRTRLIHEDASIGVVFPALFSIGVILVSLYTRQVDIDEKCVLWGDIAQVPLDSLEIGEEEYGPRGLWSTSVILIFDLLLVILFYKELKITSFDPDLAAALGLSPLLMHYLLMGAVSVTVVGAFEAVGAILVVAMLIVPPATAYLLTDRLSIMLVLSVGIGVLASTSGYFLASWLDCEIAGAMATSAGFFFVLAFLLSPRHGLLARLINRRLLGKRFREQLVLLHLRDGAAPVSVTELERRFNWRSSQLEGALEDLEGEGLVERRDEGVSITEEGAQTIDRTGTGPLVHGS